MIHISSQSKRSKQMCFAVEFEKIIFLSKLEAYEKGN